MDALEKLQNKYKQAIPVADPDPVVAPDPEPRQPAVLTSWRDSIAVCDLQQYLKDLPQITLALRDGTPALHFDPPMTVVDFKDSADVLDQACRATELALAAAADLKFLLSSGLIKLPSLDPVKPKPDNPRKPRPKRKFSDKRKQKTTSP